MEHFERGLDTVGRETTQMMGPGVAGHSHEYGDGTAGLLGGTGPVTRDDGATGRAPDDRSQRSTVLKKPSSRIDRLIGASGRLSPNAFNP